MDQKSGGVMILPKEWVRKLAPRSDNIILHLSFCSPLSSAISEVLALNSH
jgi:hypothetical protein